MTLEIKNLSVKINDKLILEKVNLTINRGEIHALMGPNGSGKSTLANVLAGRPEYQIINGTVTFDGKDLLAMKPDERSLAGFFLALQYPVEIPGLNNSYFIKAIVNAHRKSQGLQEMDAVEFLNEIKMKLKQLNMPDSLLHRALNDGFSGGEKKCNEILQLMMLQPSIAVLDETDSGLDIDTLKIVANAIQSLANKERSMLLITHYQRLLNYIEPYRVHIMIDGCIVESGDKSLAQKLEKHGYIGITQG